MAFLIVRGKQEATSHKEAEVGGLEKRWTIHCFMPETHGEGTSETWQCGTQGGWSQAHGLPDILLGREQKARGEKTKDQSGWDVLAGTSWTDDQSWYSGAI